MQAAPEPLPRAGAAAPLWGATAAAREKRPYILGALWRWEAWAGATCRGVPASHCRA